MRKPSGTLQMLLCGALVASAAAGLVATARGDASYQAAARAATTSITVISSRPDMVSGGDALVRLTLPNAAGQARVMLNRTTDITTAFKARTPGSLVGLVTGLRMGENTLEVTAGPNRANLTLTNYAVTGPIFSGPHESPYHCMTQQFQLPASTATLGPALDANCSVATRVDYVYRTTAGAFAPLPSGTRPADIAQTTTSQGKTVPYIVRVETGTINRAVYETAILSDPASEPNPSHAAPPSSWNQRLVYTFGGGCPGGWYIQGARLGDGGILEQELLARGYAVASATLNVFGNNCNHVLASETAMMVKERFSEAYAPPVFTIGTGCSGGSEQLHPMADGYPGIVDGIVVSCSFPEVTAAMIINGTDADLWRNYLSKTSLKWPEAEQLAVTGYPNTQTVASVAGTVAQRTKAQNGNCNAAVALSSRFDRTANPKGIRCDIYQHNVNIFGRDPSTGFARRPLDNVGVQYGLNALNAGKISVAQFIDLNRLIGGYDNDGVFQAGRTVGDVVAIETAYRTGQVTYGGNGMRSTPIIDYRGYNDIPADVHQSFHSWSMRARLDRVNGGHPNHVQLVDAPRGRGAGAAPVLVNTVPQMDHWLTNLAATGPLGTPTLEQVGRAKPADLVDACFTVDGVKIAEPQVYRGDTRCNNMYRPSSTPRMEAGGPLSNDILKCQVKPLSPAAYSVTFTAEEWGQLKGIFPSGVCDWTKPGMGQVPSQTWSRFK